MRPALALAALLAAAGGGASAACPPLSETLLLHSCHGGARAGLLLLPDEPLPEDGPALLVTGAYTGTEARASGAPKPVGLFVDGGRVVNPNLARMDGILLIDAAGRLALHHRARVPLGGAAHDLRDPAARARFARAAAAAGLSVMQSHLLIVEGRLDVRPREGAPLAPRRILFTDGQGFGLWQSAEPMTLHAAAAALAAAHAPEMALNLDMGSHDYCWRLLAGRAERCGLVGRTDLARFSNLLLLEGPAVAGG